MRLKALVIVTSASLAALVGLGSFAVQPFTTAKDGAKAKPGANRVKSTFGPSERLFAAGDTAGAIKALRQVQAGRNTLDVGEATFQIAEILSRKDKRASFDEYARLIAFVRSQTGYSNSRVADGEVHARMAALALDLGDRKLFGNVVDDLRSQMGQISAQIRQEIVDQKAQAGDEAGMKNVQRFEAQTEDIARQASESPLVLMARRLAQTGDIVNRDRLYEMAIKENPTSLLLYEYGRKLASTHQPRAALRVFSAIPQPYPKNKVLSIKEELRILPYDVQQSPHKTEALERKAAVEKLARLLSGADVATH